MILGYEQPVDIPVMSMYDTDMMKTYLGALKADYELGIKDEKEFMDKYGDFVSPIAGATEDYYKTGVGLLNAAYDKIRALGYDPIRSVAGRSMLRQAMRSIDRSALAKMKLSAENAKEYKKAFNELTPEQQEYERWRMLQAGMDIDKWDNTKLWTETGVQKYTGPSDYLKAQTDKIPETLHDILGPDGKTVIAQWKGVAKEDVEKYLEPIATQYFNTQQGLYTTLKQSEKYIAAGYDPKTAKKIAQQDIINSAVANATKKTDVDIDPIYKHKSDLKEKEKNRAVLWYNAKTSRISANNKNDYINVFDFADRADGKDVPYALGDAEKSKMVLKDGSIQYDSKSGRGIVNANSFRYFDRNGVKMQLKRDGANPNTDIMLTRTGHLHKKKLADGKTLYLDEFYAEYDSGGKLLNPYIYLEVERGAEVKTKK